MVSDASDQQQIQHTWPLVTMQACLHDRIKKLTPYLWPFYLTIRTSILELQVYILQFRLFFRIVRYCKFTIARKRKSDIKSQWPFTLYCMAEISFHRFHLCKGKKQTNIKNALPNAHSFLLPLLKIICSLSLILCCSASTKPIQRSFPLYVVDVMERASTPNYSSNWDWNQLFI